MGRPAFIISKDLAKALPVILPDAVGSIASMTLMVNGYLRKYEDEASFCCASSDGTAINIHLMHAAITTPEELVLVLQPTNTGHRRTMLLLLKGIESALRERGAINIENRLSGS